jgi:phosphatidylglycerophosphate synthase
MTPREKTGGTLILAGPGTVAPGSASAETLLLGMSLVRRTALAAARAGFDRVYVLTDDDDHVAAGALDGTVARVVSRDAAGPALPPGRIVLLPDRVVATPRWLRRLRQEPVEPGRLHRLGTGAIIETNEPAALVPALVGPRRLSSVLSEWEASLPSGSAVAGVSPPFEVASDADIAAAETFLLNSLVKPEDGMVTKHVSRHISLAVTRRLAPTRITPNAVSLVIAALGLAAAWSFSSPAPGRQIAGGLLFLLHSILDGCDGELARLKFRESRLGGMLDFWGDNVVHVAVFSAFALAWSSASGESWPIILGALAVSGTVLSAGFVYVYALRPRAGGEPLLARASASRQSRMARILTAVSGRDFIYLVMVLALFGKAYWFLASAAVGTPGFFVAMLVAALGGRGERGAAGTVPASG